MTRQEWCHRCNEPIVTTWTPDAVLDAHLDAPSGFVVCGCGTFEL